MSIRTMPTNVCIFFIVLSQFIVSVILFDWLTVQPLLMIMSRDAGYPCEKDPHAMPSSPFGPKFAEEDQVSPLQAPPTVATPADPQSSTGPKGPEDPTSSEGSSGAKGDGFDDAKKTFHWRFHKVSCEEIKEKGTQFTHSCIFKLAKPQT